MKLSYIWVLVWTAGVESCDREGTNNLYRFKQKHLDEKTTADSTHKNRNL